MNVEQAIAILDYTPKKAARILKKIIASAAANAKNNNAKIISKLSIAEIKVSKGLTIKRFNPVSRGRAHPINKFCSHIHVILKEEVADVESTTKPDDTKAKPKVESKAKKTTDVKETTSKSTTAKSATAKKAPSKKASTAEKSTK